MTPDELFAAKKAARKASRRGKAEEEGKLNITSLMDIVSIIVVYLLKSYGSDPVLIMPTSGQKIPMSKADSPIQEGVPVYISKRSITFNNKKIVQIDENGDIDPAALQNHLIGPLYDAMAEEAEKAKTMAANQGKDEWAGRIILVGDQTLKFATLVDVMYTAGRAEYREYALCVIQSNS
ncbi:MAG: biopolymer transporter ExbD [Deltaproteobacteria bacterium]|nr:biopolymer transporter ExbD [Deltaproteobacteria bacterium]